MTDAYRCSSCGTTSVEVDESYTSFDPRYATGHCPVCTPWPRQKKHPLTDEPIQPPRKTIQLVRADVYNAEDAARRKELRRKRRLVKDLQDGKMKDPKQITEAQLAMAELAGLTDD